MVSFTKSGAIFNKQSTQSTLFVVVLMVTFWMTIFWEYLPNWVPIPGPDLMWIVSCFRPIFFVGCGIPVAIYFIKNMFMLSKALRLAIRISDYRSMVRLFILVVLLLLAIVPFLFRDSIEDSLIHYAIKRYEPAIEAIEQYRKDHGQYPSNLKNLVPDYLPSEPRIYMKFGELLKYDPDSATGYVGYGPFTFELFGTSNGVHGQTLKYCPIVDKSCDRFRRIDNRWVWIYSSAL